MDGIHNFFEQEIIDQIKELQRSSTMSGLSDSEVSDVACIALNQFPAKYYRHGIDLRFHMPEEERQKLGVQIHAALLRAISMVEQSPRG